MFRFLCSILLVSTTLILSIEIKHPSYATYVLVRDYFSGFKAPEYSIYDKSEKNLYYRIESSYGLHDKLKLVVYPSKKVIAKIRGKTKKKLYQATFSIHNTTSNQWAEGNIIENSQWLHTNYTIEWNGSHLSIITHLITPWIVDIVDPSKSELLAQSQRRWFSWKYKYQLDLFSDRMPESVYLFAFAVASRGKNG